MDGYDVSLLDTSWFYHEENQRYKNIEVWFSKFKCWIWRMTNELWLIGSIGWHTVINWDFHQSQMFQSAIHKTLFLNLLKHWGSNNIHKDLWRNRCWWTMLVLNPNTIQWTNVLDILYAVNARETLSYVGHFIKVWTTRKRVRWAGCILGSLFSSMFHRYLISFNFEIIGYKILLYLLYLSPGFTRDTTTPDFTSINNNKCNKSLKEELLLIPTPKIDWFPVVFKPIINFPFPNNPFLNATDYMY